MELTNEIWKDIPRFEGVYQVSNLGRVKSFKIALHGRILSNKNITGDYLRVFLRSKGQRRSVSIHTLVAEAFLPVDNPYDHIHHMDGNKQNNCAENLMYVTSKIHAQISVAQNPLRIAGMVNYNKNIRPKPIAQYDRSGSFIKTYKNGQVASLCSGVCQRNILQVANKTEYKTGRVRHSAGGYVWKFTEATS